jgi:hypothetical protein
VSLVTPGRMVLFEGRLENGDPSGAAHRLSLRGICPRRQPGPSGVGPARASSVFASFHALRPYGELHVATGILVA